MATNESLVMPAKSENVFPLPILSPRLNIGCGKDYREGWLNVDLSPRVKADRYFDAFTFPWKLPSSHFEEVVVSHLVEHIPHDVKGNTGAGFFVFFEEIYRILKLGGRVIVKVPYWKHANAIIDPTHTRVVHAKSFDFFSPDHPKHYQTKANFLMSSSKTLREDRIGRYLKSHFGLAVSGLKKVELEVVLEKV